jgi:hypothetical protein
MTDTVTTPAPSARTVTFTVASALAWAGHDCDSRCPAATMQMPASLWFVPRASTGKPAWSITLVVIDIAGNATRAREIRALLREINHCTNRDGIQIRERTDTAHGFTCATGGTSAPAPPASRSAATSATGAVTY